MIITKFGFELESKGGIEFEDVRNRFSERGIMGNVMKFVMSRAKNVYSTPPGKHEGHLDTEVRVLHKIDNAHFTLLV